MERLSLKSTALVVCLISTLASQACETCSFGFSAAPKKLNGEMMAKGSRIISREQWAYEVTVENRCFRDLRNMEIQYIVFMKPDIPGQRMIAGRIEWKRKTGAASIKLLKNCSKFSFTTEGMKLKGNWLTRGSYKNGANRWAKDALKGVWLRLFMDGKQVAEYADPATLPGSEPWEAPAKKWEK